MAPSGVTIGFKSESDVTPEVAPEVEAEVAPPTPEPWEESDPEL